MRSIPCEETAIPSPLCGGDLVNVTNRGRGNRGEPGARFLVAVGGGILNVPVACRLLADDRVTPRRYEEDRGRRKWLDERPRYRGLSTAVVMTTPPQTEAGWRAPT